MNRRGFTLLELLLVLSIIVVAVSVAAPAYEGLIAGRRIFQAVDKVQLELQKARLEAVKTGQAQVFKCHVGTSEYIVQPWLKAADEVEASVGATIVTQYGQTLETSSAGGQVVAATADPTAGQKLLDEGILFADAQILSDMRAMSEQSMTDGIVAAATGWSSPILFYPDGTTTMAHIIIQDPRGRRFAVQLRNLTGEAKVIQMPSAGG